MNSKNSKTVPHDGHAVSADSRQADSRPAGSAYSRPVRASPKLFFNGIGYCSLSEAACAVLLELYVPKFQIVPGVTFQVPMGNGSSVDFMVNGICLEYHQLRFHGDRRRFGDFPDRQSYLRFIQDLYKVRHNRYKRDRLLLHTTEVLRSAYWDRRRRLIDSNPEHAGRELIVAHDVGELYEKVILRFNPLSAPMREELSELFGTLIKHIAKESRGQSERGRRAA